jgi:hypothetical protein
MKTQPMIRTALHLEMYRAPKRPRRLGLLLLTIVISVSAAALFAGHAKAGPSRGAWPTNDESRVVSFEHCASNALRVELNLGDKSDKTDILKALRIFSSYPDLRFEPVPSSAVGAAFLVGVSEDACRSSACARGAGWTELQWRLMPLRGVSVSCYLEPADRANEQAPGSARKNEGSGVTVGN